MANPAAVADALELRLLYTPNKPEPKQHAFMLLGELGVLEAMYGGAAGGGKSDTLLADALRYVDVPGYAALLLRRTYADLALPGALMDRAKTWLSGTDAHWSERDFRWTFPAGATLSFGYLQTSNDRYRYASAEFQFIGFDELTQFEEADYRFLFSRLRRPDLPDDADEDLRRRVGALAGVPLRMRSASNPGGRGHYWVKRRFIDRLPDPDDPEDTLERARSRIFIPARLEDNPHVDQASYDVALAALDKVTRARLREGDWEVDDGNKLFPPDGIAAALAIGEELDELARRALADRGTPRDVTKVRRPSARDGLDYPPPPVDGKVALGLDWGEHTHGLVGYPLEGGGLWVVAGEEFVGLEPGASTDKLLALLDYVPYWPGRPNVTDPARLVDDARFDAAGVQSMRTFAKLARVRNPSLRTVSVPFGSYKRETIGYTKGLLERAAAGHRTRVLAISGARAVEFVRQLRTLEKDPKDPELPAKGDDHGPDALFALLAPIARRNRDRGTAEVQRAKVRAQRSGQAPPPPPSRRNRP